MPTPFHIREAARKRRERTCPICGKHFIASRPTAKGICSKECQIKNFSLVTTGRKDSEETKAKKSASSRKWRVTHPEWENARLEKTISATRTEEYRQGAFRRYETMLENGTGICSPENQAIAKTINKWVLKQARAALELETDYIELWKNTQDRLRREMPYDGPLGTSDHFDYLKKLGAALTADPAIRKLQDDFMRKAIPHFHAELKRKKL